MLVQTVRRTLFWRARSPLLRTVTTLQSNPYIYAVSDPSNPARHLLTLLSTEPPTSSLAIATTTSIPPSPESTRRNPTFQPILDSVISEHAHADPQVQSQAAAMASTSGASLGRLTRGGQSGISGGGASDQAGAGSGGRGGWIHVYDNRRPPDFGRIPDPEDIFGSLEVDGSGRFVDGHGRYQASGTYRVVTRDGILGLSDFLRTKLVERLKVEEANVRNQPR